MTDSAELYSTLSDEIHTVLIGNEDVVEQLTIALLTRGHVLMEGVPGVAKTTIANLFATAIGLDYQRIQMTPDVLPADITGTEIYRQKTGEFEIRLGPIFANVVMADEINRATPKTQSALLEAMQERQVTIEGHTEALPRPFLLIATQNPIEMEGTYELPKAQRDRFQQKLYVSMPSEEEELQLLDRFDATPDLDRSAVQPVVTLDEITAAQQEVAAVHVGDRIKRYLLDVVTATRTHPDVEYGASPRATLAFLNAGKAKAAISGRDYVVPDDIKAIAPQILVHRLSLTSDAELAGIDGSDVVADILDTVSPPGENEGTDAAADASASVSDS